MLGKVSMLGRPTNLDNSRQWSVALAVGAGGGSLDIFLLSIISLCFLLFSENGPISTK